MKSPLTAAAQDVRVKSESIQRELSRLIEHVEATTRGIKDPRFRNLALKSTEVLQGLRTLFERVGTVEPRSAAQPEAAATRGEKTKGRSPASNGKDGASASPAPAKLKRSAAAAASPAGNPAPVSPPHESSKPSRARHGSSPTSVVSATPSSPIDLSAAVAKPVDPGALAAQAQLQKKAARAPKRPGGHAAPRPTPPQSGKPIWNKPHSA